MNLKSRLYTAAIGRNVRLAAPVDVGWLELLQFLWVRGGHARLRGLFTARRLGACGGRFFIGRRSKLLFPGRLSVGRNVWIGDDSYVNAYARDGMRFGDHVRIREQAWIQATSTLDQPGVGLVIGGETYIGPRCLLGAGGGIRIGSRVTFGAGVQLLAENHNFRDGSRPIQDQGVTRSGITVGDDVWVGNAVIILDGVNIGAGAVVGAGSIVTQDVDPHAIVVGNPARVVGRRT
ncbi:MAG: DapH/DapD/GlmU-related protein [Vicinamibacterales bacterium]